MRVAVLVLFSALFSLSSAFWLLVSKPRDCEWLAWNTKGPCLKKSESPLRFERIHTRVPIHADFGGKPCIGSATKAVACTAMEYSNTALQRAFFAGSSSGSTSSSRRTLNKVPVSQKKCVEDFKDESGKILMAGRQCSKSTTRRRKREAHIDSYENVLRRSKRQTILSKKHRDVLFLIDESGSVGQKNFKIWLKLVRALVQGFCGAISIGQHTTRVGVLTFNRKQWPQMDFDKYFAKATMLDALHLDSGPNTGTIKYHGYPSAGATCLVKALKYTQSDMFTVGRGARIGDTNAEKLVFLMTDGCANCENNNQLKANLQFMGEQFTQAGIPIITFLVAKDPSWCFDIMKGLSTGSQCYEQYSRSSWAELDATANAIAASPCMPAWFMGPSCPA